MRGKKRRRFFPDPAVDYKAAEECLYAQAGMTAALWERLEPQK